MYMAGMTTLVGQMNDSAEAADRLWREAYETLQKIARSRLNNDYRGAALDTGTLVSESYLRMLNVSGRKFVDRKHFYAYASQVMRSVIVDRLREMHALRRQSDVNVVSLDTNIAENLAVCDEGLEVHLALDSLAKVEPRLAQIVEMRYFGGLSETEIANALDINGRTVRRDWRKARLLLHALLKQ
jgi:RNA polymerase sigma factor (TIGR02999 family)